MSKKNKNFVNVVYSTNPNFQYQQEEQVEQGTLPNQQQKLYVSIDKKQRAGKEVTLIEGFEGTEEDLKEQGWHPFQLNVLKSDVPMYIDSDKDIIKLNLKVALQNEKVDVLEAIIKAIKDRGYQIKNAIEYEKFKVGA